MSCDIFFIYAILLTFQKRYFDITKLKLKKYASRFSFFFKFYGKVNDSIQNVKIKEETISGKIECKYG